MEQWARANLDVLRLREGDCFKAKLRQLNGREEKRIYNFLAYHQKRLEASAALAAQLAKLGCMVMAPGDTGLHAAVLSAASGSRKARSPTDAGLSAQEEGKKRTKTEARGQTGSAGRSDSCGSAGASCQLRSQPIDDVAVRGICSCSPTRTLLSARKRAAYEVKDIEHPNRKQGRLTVFD